jgi:glycosyltransferase involved in cell wall biosynthesis
LGEWKKEYLYEHLTDYNNLVLLSDGEAHPLVCCEALVAGLGLVLSEYAAANLDLSKPFITVIPDNKLNDVKYVEEKIKENRETCKKMRKEIREYGLNNFSWENIVKLYINNIEKIHKNNL